ncbi:MAG: TrmB family transcriptional regulator [Sulfurovaceae bacterium]|nr:TrmB family transcriptional regulator [Sulfurovaceae bacterium]
MIVKQDFLNKLKSLGLNSYEAKLWLALLSVGTSTAGELSDIANVPRSRSYDVLEGLEKKGFIMTRLGKPIKYLAIPPSEVLERVKNKIKKEFDEKEEVMDEMKESPLMKDLHDLHNKSSNIQERIDLTGSIKGRDKIYTHMNTMIKNAEKSIVLITSEEGLKRKNKQIGKSIDKAKNKGINITTYISSKKSIDKFKHLQDKFNIKYTDKIKSRMCIIDNKEVLLMLHSDDSIDEDYDVAIWLNTPYVASAINDMVEYTHN